MPLADFAWSTPTRKTITSATAFFALLAAIGGAVAQYDNLMWVVPSPVAYVNQQIKIAGGPLQLDIANGKKESTEARIDDFELRKLKAATDEEKLKIDQAIRRQQETLRAIENQINTLTKTQK